MKMPLFAVAAILAVSACAPVGVTKPIKGDDFQAFKAEDMLTFAIKRFGEPVQAGVAAPTSAVHPSFKNVASISYPTRVSSGGPSAYRPYNELKGFCEMKGYQFTPAPDRDPRMDLRPWPYVQGATKDGKQFAADIREVARMNVMQGWFQARSKRLGWAPQTPVTPSTNQSENIKYYASTVYRKLLPDLLEQGAVGEYDCGIKSKTGNPDDGYVYASVSIYPYRVYPSSDPDFGKMDFSIRVYQSNF